jgi:hypothetical protein
MQVLVLYLQQQMAQMMKVIAKKEATDEAIMIF